MDALEAGYQMQIELSRPPRPLFPTFNMTMDWLEVAGKSHLARAVADGTITGMTAFKSAIDPRELPERLADWDKRRRSFVPKS